MPKVDSLVGESVLRSFWGPGLPQAGQIECGQVALVLNSSIKKPFGTEVPKGVTQSSDWQGCQSCYLATSTVSSSNGLADRIESRVSLVADRLDRDKADNDDQSEHNSVFNCCRTVFRSQETLDLLREILHLYFSRCELNYSRLNN